MTAPLTLSRFQSAQAAEVAGWVRSLDEARAWCGHRGDALPTASTIHEWHKSRDVHPYVLVADSSPVAYGEIWVDRAAREIELARLIVSAKNRSRGIGRRLVEELVATASEFGFSFAYVRVVPENAAALSCYRHAGFVRVSDGDEKRFNAGQPIAYTWLRRQMANRSSRPAPEGASG